MVTDAAVSQLPAAPLKGAVVMVAGRVRFEKTFAGEFLSQLGFGMHFLVAGGTQWHAANEQFCFGATDGALAHKDLLRFVFQFISKKIVAPAAGPFNNVEALFEPRG